MRSKLLSSLDAVKTLPVITLGAIVEHMESEALLILCLVSILPFMQPIPIPGVSSLLGLIVFFQGLGMVFWGKPLLTKKMKMAVISHERFEKIFHVAEKFEKYASKLSAFKHPVAASRGSHILAGISIILSAAFLSLPLPIPFSNLIPALSIALLCLGLLEEDIILILCGHGIAATVIWMAIFSFHLIKEQFSNWF
jgi:hypothetical protein